MKQGWKIKKLSAVMTIERGGSPRPIEKYLTDSSDGINWIKISDATASDKYIYETQQKITREGLNKTRLVHEGDFLLSNSMSFGRPYIMKTTGCIHDGWLVLRNKPEFELDKDFLYHLLSSPYVFQQFDRLAAGSTVRNLNIGLVSSVIIPIPPLPEQQRIVTVLDEAFASIAQVKANAERNLVNARELFEAVLREIFSNRQDSWKEKSLEELGQITSSKRIYKNEYVKEGVPFYRIKEVKELAHDKEISIELYISDIRYKEIKEVFGVPLEGDLLMTAVGPIGEIYIVKKDDKFYFKDGNVLWFKDFESIDPYFLKFALSAFVEKIKKLSIGAAYNALTIEKIEKHKILIPPLSEQRAIIEKLEALSAETKRLEGIYQSKLAALEELKKSVLAKAFEGGV